MKLVKMLAVTTMVSLVFFSTSFASDALVAAWTADSGNGGIGSPRIVLKPSKGVTVAYFRSDTQVGSGYMNCSMSAWHSSGTKTFATSSTDTKIYMYSGLSMSAPAPSEAAGVSLNYGSGWTAM